MCGGELLLFSAADDFRSPVAALPLRRLFGGDSESEEAPSWRHPLLAWSPPARQGDPPALALAAAGIVRVLDASVRALCASSRERTPDASFYARRVTRWRLRRCLAALGSWA